MALESSIFHLLLFSILLPSGALLTLHTLQAHSESIRPARILQENNSSRASNSSSNSSYVPAMFIFGDSSADCGTGIINRWLQERADHLPYGRDFDTHRPTGRFCNGRIPVDYLGMILNSSFLLLGVFFFFFGLWRVCFGENENDVWIVFICAFSFLRWRHFMQFLWNADFVSVGGKLD